MEILHGLVAVLALLAGCCCVGMFLYSGVRLVAAQVKAGSKPAPDEAAAKLMEGRITAPVSVPELTDLVKALSALADSLAKAGPGIASLVGGLFFFVLAALMSSSVLAPPHASTNTDASAGQNQADNAAIDASSSAAGGNDISPDKNGS